MTTPRLSEEEPILDMTIARVERAVDAGQRKTSLSARMVRDWLRELRTLRRTVERQQAELDVLRDTKLGMAWVKITHENADLRRLVSQQQAVVEAAEKAGQAVFELENRWVEGNLTLRLDEMRASRAAFELRQALAALSRGTVG